MKAAVIDIGTNTMLLLAAEIDKETLKIKPMLDVLRLPRLGKGVDAKKRIPAGSINKAITVINEYKKKVSDLGITAITATATSFIRDSNNQMKFINALYKETGITAEILSGEDEAKWSFWGGISGIDSNETKDKYLCIIDIGGGSTEISYARLEGHVCKDLIVNTNITSYSTDLGSVRLHEKFITGKNQQQENFSLIKDFIDESLKNVKLSGQDMVLIGVAGTVTTLAAIKLGLKLYDADRIKGSEMTLNEIEEIFETISKYNREELIQLGDYMEGREDIILPGILILMSFMKRFMINRITTSTRGLRYGILIREAIK